MRLVPMPMARLLGAGLRLSSGASSPARGAETLCQTAKKEGTKQKQPDPSHVGTTCRRGTRVAETDLSHPSCNQLLDLLRRPNCSPATYKIKNKNKKKIKLSLHFKSSKPHEGLSVSPLTYGIYMQFPMHAKSISLHRWIER